MTSTISPALISAFTRATTSRSSDDPSMSVINIRPYGRGHLLDAQQIFRELDDRPSQPGKAVDCGLGIVTRTSSDWVRTPDSRWVRAEVQRNPGAHPSAQSCSQRYLQGCGDERAHSPSQQPDASAVSLAWRIRGSI